MKKTAIWIIIFCIGGTAGWLTSSNMSNKKSQDISEIRSGGYEYINPLLECELGGALQVNLLKPFKNKVQSTIDERLNNGSITAAAVYYRDLNNGPTFGINENMDFTPQSLLKVPVMIAYYKLAQADPSILEQELTLTDPEKYAPDTAYPDHDIQLGQSYTVDELINKMIIYSNNNAFTLLLGSIDIDRINQVHQDLGLTLLESTTPEDFISVKEYASLFRVLYNASYLNRDMSERALGLLSQTVFADGVVQGVPEQYTVAHKYGIRETENSSERQLHDCGIVYYPEHPYLICIMSRGTNFDQLSETIQAVSEVVFSEISNN